ncbi:MAG: TIM barrel protein [Verrucomicrobia bacterium]|nr:TIM barrel protein [Verrucomicrobiota bacterium]
MKNHMSRRSALRTLAGTAAALSAAAAVPPLLAAEGEARTKLKGNIRHSVSAWCYGKLFNPGRNKQPAPMTFDDFCRECAKLGLESVELLGAKEWPAVKKAGMTCAMCNGPDNIGYGWNRVEHHDDLLAKFETAIPEVAANGFPNIITFSGNRKGKDKWGEYSLTDEQGLENCVKGLKRLMPLAEKHNVTVVLELLNSKVDHKGYMADKSAWGVELCRQVGSERLKLLFDIYHMQIMEGDLMRSIRDNGKFFAHYHTGGNPGRNEIDDTQEIFYPAVMKAIVASGYKGFVGQEFVPKRDPLKSLEESIKICDV